jgi:hypothetical protein
MCPTLGLRQIGLNPTIIGDFSGFAEPAIPVKQSARLGEPSLRHGGSVGPSRTLLALTGCGAQDLNFKVSAPQPRFLRSFAEWNFDSDYR